MLNVLWFDVRNIMVRDVQELQVCVLIWKVANLVEPQVGQWVGSGGFSLMDSEIQMQIGLGWVALVENGLG